MRSSRFYPLAGMMLAAAMSAGPSAVITIGDEYGDDFERERLPLEPPDPRAGERAVAPKVLSEADNTRLREAAEKRFRKAQRQARGMVTAALGPSAKANSGTNLKDQSQ